MKHKFNYMLKEYGLPYILTVVTKGHYENGDWVEGDKIPVHRRGIILTLSREELQHGMNGTYTTHDIKLFDDVDVEIGSVITWKGNEYVVNEVDPWDSYSDFHIYLCKKTEKKVTV